MTSPILSACPAHPVDSLAPVGALPASGSDAPPVIERLATARLPTRHGEFTSYVYRYGLDGAEHLALVKGDVARHTGVLVRLHSECLTGDVFGSMRCDCGEQLDRSLAMVQEQGCGAVIYLRGHEGRGIGLTNKIRAYALQDAGRDTVDANSDLGLPVDSRRYDAGAAILRDLEILSVRLMSNNPRKFAALEAAGMQVVERVPLKIAANPENVRYLEAKRHRLGHFLAD